MSEIVATLPQGTQVVVEAQLLTSDVDHTIEEVRQEVQQQQNGLPGIGAVSRNSNRTLFCRKCEGHGQQVVLKGHASRCPYNNCQCKTCSNVMSMRANAIIRRYRTRTLEGGLVLKPVHFKNGNTRLRVFPKYVDESDALPIPMGQQLAAAQMLREKNQIPEGLILEQVRHLQSLPQTPPETAVPNGLNSQQPPFPFKRSFSEQELELHRQSGSPKQSSLEQSPTNFDMPQTSMSNVSSLTLLEMILRQQGLNPELLNTGLLPITTQPTISTIPSNFDNSSLFGGLTFPNTTVSYSSPTTYSNSFMSSNPNSGFPSGLESDRKISDAALISSAAQLSELNIGVTTNSPVHSMAELAPKLTPNMFESCNNMQNLSTDDQSEHSNQEKCESTGEPFTPNLMIAPTADRSHPLFRKFLNTVRELEKQMLVDLDS